MTWFSRLRGWLQRHRRLALFLSAAFLIFEISRAAAIGEYLLPEWSARAAPPIAVIQSLPPWVAVISVILAVVFFVVPMAGVIYLGIRIRRALVPLLNKR